MELEWDPIKARANSKKHGVDFADAVAVLEDPYALSIQDCDHGEERFVTIGLDAFGRVLVVVYTYRGENIRVISARKAIKYEREQYSSRGNI